MEKNYWIFYIKKIFRYIEFSLFEIRNKFIIKKIKYPLIKFK